MPTHQYSLVLIEHHVNDSVIKQRSSDGYINATELCRAAGKRWHNYVRNETTGHFLRALATKTQISVSVLIQEVRSPVGVVSTWVHPKVAIHLAQWLSADFAVQVSEWVYDWLSGSGGIRQAALPYHLQRHMDNLAKVPPTHFSILQEMTATLIAPLEVHGYRLPDAMVPDISQGKMFAKFAREQLHLDTDALPTYKHSFPDGRVADAKLYPVEVLGPFRRFISEVWMPKRAHGYFRERDPRGLPALDRVLQLSYQKPATSTDSRLASVSGDM